MIWRFLKSLFIKTAAQRAAEEAAEKAYRAKRAAQRKAQRARKNVSATPAATSDMSPATSGDIRRHVGDMSATVGDTPLIEKNINIEGGARISDDWEPDKRSRQLAAEVFGERADAEITNFRDYWQAQSGARATRSDWQAQFRWWVRRQSASQPQLQLVTPVEGGRQHGRRKSKSLAESGAELAAEFRERELRGIPGGPAGEGTGGSHLPQAGGERGG